MELVKIYNNRNEYIDKIKDRKELENGEYRNLVHIWIINSKGEFLLQRRSEMKKHFPNMWSVTSGCVHSDGWTPRSDGNSGLKRKMCLRLCAAGRQL